MRLLAFRRIVMPPLSGSSSLGLLDPEDKLLTAHKTYIAKDRIFKDNVVKTLTFCVAQKPNWGLGRLIVEVTISQTIRQTRCLGLL
jgi:hypothetical protein